MQKAQRFFFISSIVLFFILFLLFTVPKIKDIVTYTFVFISTSLIFILLCWQILKYNISKKYIIGIIGLVFILKIALLFIHPIGSDDYYRYIWDGKVQANGINPYKYAPSDAALNNLHSADLPKMVNYPKMKTIYPPLGENLFYLSYLISGESFLGLKIFLLFFDILIIWGIYLILKKLKLPFKNILIYVLCPLPIFQFIIDAHVDGFGLPLILFAIYFYLDRKKFLSYIFLGLSICIKPVGLLLIPILFLNEKDFIERLKTLFVPILVCGLLYLPYIFTGAPFQSLIRFTENWTFNGIIFDILDSFIRDNQVTRIICGFLLVITYLPVIFSHKELITKIYLSIFLLMIFSPVVHPWYISWLLIILPFVTRWSGIAFAALISLTSFTVLHYQLQGIWEEYTWVLALEYVPVLTLFLYELYKSSKPLNKSLVT
jgi:hypothetical protein